MKSYPTIKLLKALVRLEEQSSQALNWVPHILLIGAVNEARKVISELTGKPLVLIPEDFGTEKK